MSRALNLNASVAEVSALCETLGISTTSIEALIPSGTRVVCQNSVGAATLRTKLKAKLIDGAIKRLPLIVRGR